MRRFVHLIALSLLAVTVTGCAASVAFRRGERATRAGDWDAAVTYYREAVQADPRRAEYKIALERAMLNASHVHLAAARDFEVKGELDQALREYRRASEYDPSNRQAAARVGELERTIRDRIEAARPKPAITQMRERARQTTPEPILNPASREPLSLRFTNASVRDILNFIANASGINVTYDREFQDRPYTVQLDGVTLEQGLNQILTANGYFYKVLNERTIIVVSDTPQKRAQYEEQVIRTFFISHADATELTQLINTVIRSPQMAVQPQIAANKTANTITVRATAAVAAIIERVIEANDKPRAEIVLDVEILEVNRNRTKQFGLNLTDYGIGTIFSPEVAPGGATPAPTAPSAVGSPPPFNLNTISAGISTADFFLAVPAAVVKFLEEDSETRLVAKPQLRGAEGQKLTLNLGDDIPVASTAFTPIATGGAATNPLTSFTYRAVGVNLEMTPRVTFEGDIIVDLIVENSARAADVSVAGVTVPSFSSRKVTTRLRLRDGESNLLAGLLRENERRSLRGFPGLLRVPVVKQLFSANDNRIETTDIVMLLTPRIIRTHEITQQDLNPIYIGTQPNPSLTGPPPLIAPPPGAAEGGGAAPAQPQPAPVAPPPAPPGAAAPGVPRPPAAAAPGVPSTTPAAPPPGTSPVPGTVIQPPAQPPPATAPPAEPQPPAPPPAAEPSATPPPATGAAQVLLTPPGTEFRVGGGPYTVPISINGASRVSTVTLTVTFNPAVLRVRAVQEGSFMRQGGTNATFTQQVDQAAGRLDIAITRPGDATGASGSGLLAAILFEAAAPGSTTLSPSGVATGPTGTPLPLQFTPVAIAVR